MQKLLTTNFSEEVLNLKPKLPECACDYYITDSNSRRSFFECRIRQTYKVMWFNYSKINSYFITSKNERNSTFFCENLFYKLYFIKDNKSQILIPFRFWDLNHLLKEHKIDFLTIAFKYITGKFN